MKKPTEWKSFYNLLQIYKKCFGFAISKSPVKVHHKAYSWISYMVQVNFLENVFESTLIVWM